MLKSRKLCLLLSMLLIFTVFAVGCGGNANQGNDSNAQAEDTSLDDILAKGKLVVGADDEFAPMGFRDTAGEMTGFDIELAKLVAEKLGVELESQAIDWNAKEVLLENGSIDAIWNGYTITKARNESVEFTKPYMNNAQVIVVAIDSEIQSKADLNGKVIGAQVDSSGLAALNADPDLSQNAAEIPEYDTYQTALMDLGTSRLDALVIDQIYIGYAMAQEPGKYRILDETLGDELYGIGLKKGSVALREAIDNALDELQEDGSIEALSTEWFGSNIVIRDIPKLTDAELS